MVRSYRIIGTDIVVYEALEPYDGHSTVTHIDGVAYGRIGTRRLPAHLDALPAMSDERARKVQAWREHQCAEAYEAIAQAYPITRGGERCMGSVEVVEPARRNR